MFNSIFESFVWVILFIVSFGSWYLLNCIFRAIVDWIVGHKFFDRIDGNRRLVVNDTLSGIWFVVGLILVPRILALDKGLTVWTFVLAVYGGGFIFCAFIAAGITALVMPYVVIIVYLFFIDN